jgi:hypothetical protein
MKGGGEGEDGRRQVKKVTERRGGQVKDRRRTVRGQKEGMSRT